MSRIKDDQKDYINEQVEKRLSRHLQRKTFL